MSDYPAWLAPREEPAPAVEVDWAALPEDWRARDYRIRRVAESPAEHANRVRACVAEGLAPAQALAFADRLEGILARCERAMQDEPPGGFVVGPGPP